MTSFPLTVIEPRPCLPEGRVPLVTTIAAGAAAKWAASRPLRGVLTAGIVASAAYGMWRPVSLLVTLALGVVLVRAVYREDVVTEVLGPYVAAAVGTFGPEAVDVLSQGLTRPARRDHPIAWLLDGWQTALTAAQQAVECGFGEHRIGCEHFPFRAGETDTRCWPAPFNDWLGRVRAAGLAR
jgi:hypothetical protein